MHYVTIVLELIEQHPRLYEKLKSEKRLLATAQQLAAQLKSDSAEWVSRLRRMSPALDEIQRTSQALEISVAELRALLTRIETDETNPPSLDAVMTSLASEPQS